MQQMQYSCPVFNGEYVNSALFPTFGSIFSWWNCWALALSLLTACTRSLTKEMIFRVPFGCGNEVDLHRDLVLANGADSETPVKTQNLRDSLYVLVEPHQVLQGKMIFMIVTFRNFPLCNAI